MTIKHRKNIDKFLQQGISVLIFDKKGPKLTIEDSQAELPDNRQQKKLDNEIVDEGIQFLETNGLLMLANSAELIEEKQTSSQSLSPRSVIDCKIEAKSVTGCPSSEGIENQLTERASRPKDRSQCNQLMNQNKEFADGSLQRRRFRLTQIRRKARSKEKVIRLIHFRRLARLKGSRLVQVQKVVEDHSNCGPFKDNQRQRMKSGENSSKED